jgi:hypothetical protein
MKGTIAEALSSTLNAGSVLNKYRTVNIGDYIVELS